MVDHILGIYYGGNNIYLNKIFKDKADVKNFKYLRTVLLWVTFFTSAASESVRPPTLLDIRDRLNCSTEEATYQFSVQAAGGLAGCLISGFLADRYYFKVYFDIFYDIEFRLTGSQTYLFLFISCLGHALPTLMFPFHSSVILMCFNSFIFGLFNGTFHTSANVLLLDIWRGRKSSPYMYTLHLFFGLGSFLTPLVTEEFQNTESFYKNQLQRRFVHAKINIADVKSLTTWNVDNLYLIIGGLLGVSSIGYLYYYFIDKQFEYKCILKDEDVDFITLTPVEEEKCTETEEEILYVSSKPTLKLSRRTKMIFILLMTSFNFFFAGVEGSFKNFVPAFGSHCQLHLSRQEGSNLSGIFFGTYTVNRVFLILGSMYASATTDMWISLFLCFVSCIVLHVWGLSSKLGLQIGMFY